jgi:hemolysin activation/secretion protein
LGGGAVFTAPDGRLSINPEATVSQTQPFAQAGVPRTRGKLARFSLRTNYSVQRLRNRAITIGFAIEHLQEANDAIDFDTRLSLDRFTVGRLQANFAGILPGGIGAAIGAAFSHGLGGLDLSAGVTDPSMPGPSRQGASPRFSKATVSVRLSKAVMQGWNLALIARGQTAFGAPLFRSEQTTLEGSDALSGYVGGATAVDTGATGRLELEHPVLGTRAALAVTMSAYGFVAAGIGRLERPSALERASLSAENAGVGLRMTCPKLGFGLSVEYARGFSIEPAFDRTNRISVSLGKSF